MATSLKVITLLFCVSTTFCSAQTVKVKKETARVKGENTEGQAVELEGAAQEVTTSFQKYLKTLGKVKQSDGLFQLTESSLHGSNTKIAIYGMIKEQGGKSVAWIGVNGEWPTDDATRLNKELEKTAYEFGVKFYKDRIQTQIDESNQALQAVEKQQQKLTFENKNLNSKMEFNQQQKARLEKSLENNKLEYEDLVQRLEKNKHDQDSVAVAGEQIKKVVEAHKERQGKVK